MNLFFWKNKTNRKVARRPKLYRMSRGVLDWITLGSKGVVVSLLVIGLYHFLAGSTYFKLKEVDVKGSMEHINKEGILSLAQVPLGDNIFGLNLLEIGQNIRRFPWIKDVQVRRQFPSKLLITVSEYVPVAVVLATRESQEPPLAYLMSEEGILFKKIDEPQPEYPLITGFKQEQLEKYPAYFQTKIKEVFSFLNLIQKSEIKNILTLKEVRYDLVDGLYAYMSFQNSVDEVKKIEIFFGKDSFEKKFFALGRLSKVMKEENVVYNKIDLHVDGKIFAKLL